MLLLAYTYTPRHLLDGQTRESIFHQSYTTSSLLLASKSVPTCHCFVDTTNPHIILADPHTDTPQLQTHILHYTVAHMAQTCTVAIHGLLTVIVISHDKQQAQDYLRDKDQS